MPKFRAKIRAYRKFLLVADSDCLVAPREPIVGATPIATPCEGTMKLVTFILVNLVYISLPFYNFAYFYCFVLLVGLKLN